MRQGQQNRRGRGRNRKGQSPLTRSFESTGPDVKIRGTPAHIAEKYITLARDATSSGDPVLAENYLQHAEHYNRIIMAFRDQNMAQGGDMVNGGVARPQRPFMGQDSMDPGDDYGDDDGDEGDAQFSQQPVRQQEQPQPRMEGQRFEGNRGGNDHNNNNNRFRDRNDRHDRHDRNDRHERPERGNDQRNFQPPRPQAAEPGPDAPSQQAEGQRRRERFAAPAHEQPEFLRRPVRRPRRDGNGSPSEANGGTIAEESETE